MRDKKEALSFPFPANWIAPCGAEFPVDSNSLDISGNREEMENIASLLD